MLKVEYDGTDFFGWQLQPDRRTVQGQLERALTDATGRHSRVVAASRTDAGVHAEGQTAHFDTESDLPAETLCNALNHYLPKDVAVLSAREVPQCFHARFTALSKLYCYRILVSPLRRPLRERSFHRVAAQLDTSSMRLCASLLIGAHDFASFTSAGSQNGSTARTVMRSDLAQTGDEIHYHVEADAFTYNMVRAIAGTLIEVGRGRYSVDHFRRLLQARDRGQAGPTAPGKGLTLVRVRYPRCFMQESGRRLC